MKMNLQNWLNEGRLQRHSTSVKEIADLLKIVDRDLADAAIKEISADRRFATRQPHCRIQSQDQVEGP